MKKGPLQSLQPITDTMFWSIFYLLCNLLNSYCQFDKIWLFYDLLNNLKTLNTNTQSGHTKSLGIRENISENVPLLEVIVSTLAVSAQKTTSNSNITTDLIFIIKHFIPSLNNMYIIWNLWMLFDDNLALINFCSLL